MERWIGAALVLLGLLAAPARATAGTPFAEATNATRGVAEAYFDAYIARDWDRLEPLLAPSGGFSDPTATLVFGPVDLDGKAATLRNFREGYASITEMSFTPSRAFVSGEYAVFEGTLDWTLELSDGRTAVTRAMPFLSVLRVVDGQVLEHTDYADYTPFLAAAAAARANP